MSHIFISHSTKNNNVALKIVALLKRHRIACWIDTERLRDKTEAWQQKIVDEGIEPASAVMILVSPDARASTWVNSEIEAARIRTKKFLVVLVDGDERDIPLGLTTFGRIDLRGGLTADKETELISAISITQIEAPLADAELPSPQREGVNPFPVRQVIFNDLILQTIIAQVRRVSKKKLTWRASLLWFQKNHWYVASATSGYNDYELSTWLEKGKGFAGQIWADNNTLTTYHSIKPDAYSADELAHQYKLNAEQVSVLQRMQTIICYPIVNPSTGEMVGILSLDALKPEGSTNVPVEDIPHKVLAEIGLYVPSLQIIADYTALHYQSFRGLRTILRAARLLPPLTAPSRAAIYWEHTRTGELYMIASSERDPSEWSTKPPTFKRHEQPEARGLVRQTWITGDAQSEQIEAHVWGMALPIHDAKQPKKIVGVLTLEWDHAPSQIPGKSEIEQQTHQLAYLADLAAKVLDGRTHPWYSAP